jgi:hypothetical protein
VTPAPDRPPEVAVNDLRRDLQRLAKAVHDGGATPDDLVELCLLADSLAGELGKLLERIRRLESEAAP